VIIGDGAAQGFSREIIAAMGDAVLLHVARPV
jgi:hypothetical protein